MSYRNSGSFGYITDLSCGRSLSTPNPLWKAAAGLLSILLSTIFLLLSFPCQAAETAIFEKEIMLSPLLDKAKIQYISPVTPKIHVTEMLVKGIEKEVIFQHPDSKIQFPEITVHKNAFLEFEYGIDQRTWKLHGDGVRFEIRAKKLFGEKVLFSHYIDPKNKTDDRRWFKTCIPLESFADKKVTLTFLTFDGDNHDGRNDWSGWACPRIISSGIPKPVAAPKHRNIILIVVDTLRANRLGIYGYEKAITPNIDNLAKSSIIFDNAFSHIPITGPSHASIFTSKYPSEIPVTNNIRVLPDKIPLLSQTLESSGFLTAGFVSLGVLNRNFGFARGFHDYFDLTSNKSYWIPAEEINKKVFSFLDTNYDKPLFLFIHYSDPHEPYMPPEIVRPGLTMELNGKPVEDFYFTLEKPSKAFLHLVPGENQLNFISLAPGKPLFGEVLTFKLINLTLTGSPANVKIKYSSGWVTMDRGPSLKGTWMKEKAQINLINESSQASEVILDFFMKEVLTLEEISMRYDMEIRYVDREIGLLLNRLDELKLLKSSILIFTSDHGENLGDHHSVGHIHDLYDTLIKIPLIIKFPGCTVAARYQEIVSLIDIFPTIMDLAGLPVPAGLRGESIMPLLSGKSRVTHQFHYAETYPPEAKFQKNAIRTTDWKLIKTSDPMLLELYDLKKYPDESNNLAQHMKEKSENLLKTLESCIAELNSRIPTENNSTAKKDVEFLKALGYRE